MSLDLTGDGFSFTTAAITDLTAVVAGSFDGGAGNIASDDLNMQIDTTAMTAAQANLSNLPLPNTLEVCPGATLSVVKVNTGGETVRYTDPVTGITYAFVNKQGESITLEADTVGNQWVVRP